VVAGLETVFIMTNPDFAFTSSSLIKQIASMGGDVSALVPEIVVEAMRAKTTPPPSTDDHLKETP
jgi:pantetheine-phosphate adenylyltransferase